MNKKRIFKEIIFFLAFLIIPVFAYSQQSSPEIRKLIVFYSPNCHKCKEVKNELMPDIEKKFKHRIQIEYRDISDIENYKLLLSLQEKYGVKIKNVIPVFYFEGQFLDATAQIKRELIPLIENSINKPMIEEKHPPRLDLVSRFLNFSLWTVTSAGLIDGINPCAFTVIVFFISFLSMQGYQKRELIIIGLTFVFAVFLTYLLIGVGLFNFLYRLEEFWVVSRILNFSIGIFSIILGIIALYDFYKFRKTGLTEGLMLQLPQVVKKEIHSVIGIHYRNTQLKEGRVVKINIFRLLLSALLTGFLISILEAVCTGQVYLPTITFVLKTSRLKIQSLGYLLLYNVMFITPLLLIFFFALLGVTSGQFSKYFKKHLLAIKILMAALFFSLGILLIWRS